MTNHTNKPVLEEQVDTSVELANLDEPVFGMCLSVLVGTPQAYNDWLDDVGFKGDRLNPDTRKAIWQDLRPDNMADGKTNSEFIWLRDKDLPSLAHELIHLTTKMFEDKDIPISHANDEVLCYYVEYWLRRISQAWGNDLQPSDSKANTEQAKSQSGDNLLKGGKND